MASDRPSGTASGALLVGGGVWLLLMTLVGDLTGRLLSLGKGGASASSPNPGGSSSSTSTGPGLGATVAGTLAGVSSTGAATGTGQPPAGQTTGPFHNQGGG